MLEVGKTYHIRSIVLRIEPKSYSERVKVKLVEIVKDDQAEVGVFKYWNRRYKAWMYAAENIAIVLRHEKELKPIKE
jgi:hypothetical protein